MKKLIRVCLRSTKPPFQTESAHPNRPCALNGREPYVGVSSITKPGRDNDDDGANPHHGRDAFGMTLNYHIGDFIKANSPFHFNVQPTGMTIQGLYNGNIAGWMWNSRNDAGNAQTRLGSVYRYDQLNRLRVDSVHTTTTSTWTPGSTWMSMYTYDADGNLDNLYRADDGSSGLDNLKYHYYTSHPNRLQRVEEQLAGATSYVGDLENQTDPSNYAYDPTGNLTQDVSENIRSGGIVWTPYNKIDRIKKVSDAGVQIMKLAYLYDAAGNRVVKDHYATDTTTHTTRTYYVRDAQGNVMGIFKRTMSGYDIERQETPIYGSTRLGVAYNDRAEDSVSKARVATSRSTVSTETTASSESECAHAVDHVSSRT